MLGRYGGGRAGLSDTMAGTFWVLDALCELGKAGAAGLLFHWGLGGAEDGTMGSPNTGVQTNFFYKVGGKRLEYKELKSRGVSDAPLRGTCVARVTWMQCTCVAPVTWMQCNTAGGRGTPPAGMGKPTNRQALLLEYMAAGLLSLFNMLRTL